MENTARAIIKMNDNYIFMRREKKINDEIKIFYATVGGHLEKYESFEDACIREVYEELGIVVEIDSLFYELDNTDLNKYEKFYMVNYISGDIGTGNGEEFTNIDIDKYGKYEVSFINKNELSDYNILPTQVKEKLIKEIDN